MQKERIKGSAVQRSSFQFPLQHISMQLQNYLSVYEYKGFWTTIVGLKPIENQAKLNNKKREENQSRELADDAT